MTIKLEENYSRLVEIVVLAGASAMEEKALEEAEVLLESLRSGWEKNLEWFTAERVTILKKSAEQISIRRLQLLTFQYEKKSEERREKNIEIKELQQDIKLLETRMIKELASRPLEKIQIGEKIVGIQRKLTVVPVEERLTPQELWEMGDLFQDCLLPYYPRISKALLSEIETEEAASTEDILQKAIKLFPQLEGRISIAIKERLSNSRNSIRFMDVEQWHEPALAVHIGITEGADEIDEPQDVTVIDDHGRIWHLEEGDDPEEIAGRSDELASWDWGGMFQSGSDDPPDMIPF